MTEAERHVKEVEAASTALRREGKVDKDTYDWFSREYLRSRKELARKSRHE